MEASGEHVSYMGCLAGQQGAWPRKPPRQVAFKLLYGWLGPGGSTFKSLYGRLGAETFDSIHRIGKRPKSKTFSKGIELFTYWKEK